MLIVTNVAKVNEIFEAKTPRPIRDIMLEIYPEAVEDANGRFHAPHDGYVCPITEREFRGGEYLPTEEPDDSYRVMGSARVYPTAVDLEGKVHNWDGTRGQNVAVWQELISQSRAHEAKISQHIGTVGEKIELELTVSHIAMFPGYYANVHVHIMHDAARNVVIYKGSNKRLAEKGAKIKVSAKVKAHGEREGVKQTIIERPKVMK